MRNESALVEITERNFESQVLPSDLRSIMMIDRMNQVHTRKILDLLRHMVITMKPADGISTTHCAKGFPTNDARPHRVDSRMVDAFRIVDSKGTTVRTEVIILVNHLPATHTGRETRLLPSRR